MKIVREGFKYSRKRFTPPASPKGFTWPTTPTAEDKRNFAAAIKRLSDERGMDSSAELAKAITGVVINTSGVTTARDGTSIRQWWKAKAIPREENAMVLAAYFNVPLAELVAPAKPRNGHANGHAAGNGASEIRAAAPRPEAVPLPPSASPPVVKIETFADDPRFVSVTVTGTVPMDLALSIMALLDSRHRGGD